MAWYRAYQKKNERKKWNSLVNTISNDREAQQLLKRQAQQNRDYAQARRDSARQKSVTTPDRMIRFYNQLNKRNKTYTAIPLRRQKQQQRDYSIAVKESEEEEKEEVFDRSAFTGYKPQPGGLGPTLPPSGIITFDKPEEGLFKKDEEESLNNQLQNELDKLEIPNDIRTGLFSILHKDSLVDIEAFDADIKGLIEEVRGGNFANIESRLGTNADPLRRKIIDSARSVLEVTKPGKGRPTFAEGEEFGYDVGIPGWRNYLNKPVNLVSIRASHKNTPYFGVLGIDATEAVFAEGEKQNIPTVQLHTNQARINAEWLVIASDDKETAVFIDDWINYYLSEEGSGKEDATLFDVPALPPMFRDTFKIIGKQLLEQLFSEEIEELGSLDKIPAEGIPLGDVGPGTRTAEELVNSLLLALNLSGDLGEQPIPQIYIDRRQGYDEDFKDIGIRIKSGELGKDEAKVELQALERNIEALDFQEKKIRHPQESIVTEEMWEKIDEVLPAGKINHTLRNIDTGKSAIHDFLQGLTDVGGITEKTVESARIRNKLGTDEVKRQEALYDAFVLAGGASTADNKAFDRGGYYFAAGGKVMEYLQWEVDHIGRPIAEFFFPNLAEVIKGTMLLTEKPLVGYEKVIEAGFSGIGIDANVPSVEGISESVRKVVSGDAALFLGISTVDIGAEIFVPSSFLAAVPFLGYGSKFGKLVRAGKYAQAFAVFVDEVLLTGNSPEILRGAYAGVKGLAFKGLAKTLGKNPDLVENPFFRKYVINYFIERDDEALRGSLNVLGKQEWEQRADVSRIMNSTIDDGEKEILLAKYPESVRQQVATQLKAISLGYANESSRFFFAPRVGDLVDRGIEVPLRGTKYYERAEELRAGYKADITKLTDELDSIPAGSLSPGQVDELTAELTKVQKKFDDLDLFTKLEKPDDLAELVAKNPASSGRKLPVDEIDDALTLPHGEAVDRLVTIPVEAGDGGTLVDNIGSDIVGDVKARKEVIPSEINKSLGENAQIELTNKVKRTTRVLDDITIDTPINSFGQEKSTLDPEIFGIPREDAVVFKIARDPENPSQLIVSHDGDELVRGSSEDVALYVEDVLNNIENRQAFLARRAASKEPIPVSTFPRTTTYFENLGTFTRDISRREIAKDALDEADEILKFGDRINPSQFKQGATRISDGVIQPKEIEDELNYLRALSDDLLNKTQAPTDTDLAMLKKINARITDFQNELNKRQLQPVWQQVLDVVRDSSDEAQMYAARLSDKMIKADFDGWTDEAVLTYWSKMEAETRYYHFRPDRTEQEVGRMIFVNGERDNAFRELTDGRGYDFLDETDQFVKRDTEDFIEEGLQNSPKVNDKLFRIQYRAGFRGNPVEFDMWSNKDLIDYEGILLSKKPQADKALQNRIDKELEGITDILQDRQFNEDIALAVDRGEGIKGRPGAGEGQDLPFSTNIPQNVSLDEIYGRYQYLNVSQRGISDVDVSPDTIDKQMEFLVTMKKQVKKLKADGAPIEEIRQLQIDINNYNDTLKRQDPVGYEERFPDFVDVDTRTGVDFTSTRLGDSVADNVPVSAEFDAIETEIKTLTGRYSDEFIESIIENTQEWKAYDDYADEVEEALGALSGIILPDGRIRRINAHEDLVRFFPRKGKANLDPLVAETEEPYVATMMMEELGIVRVTKDRITFGIQFYEKPPNAEQLASLRKLLSDVPEDRSIGFTAENSAFPEKIIESSKIGATGRTRLPETNQEAADYFVNVVRRESSNVPDTAKGVRYTNDAGADDANVFVNVNDIESGADITTASAKKSRQVWTGTLNDAKANEAQVRRLLEANRGDVELLQAVRKWERVATRGGVADPEVEALWNAMNILDNKWQRARTARKPAIMAEMKKLHMKIQDFEGIRRDTVSTMSLFEEAVEGMNFTTRRIVHAGGSKIVKKYADDGETLLIQNINDVKKVKKTIEDEIRYVTKQVDSQSKKREQAKLIEKMKALDDFLTELNGVIKEFEGVELSTTLMKPFKRKTPRPEPVTVENKVKELLDGDVSRKDAGTSVMVEADLPDNIILVPKTRGTPIPEALPFDVIRDAVVTEARMRAKGTKGIEFFVLETPASRSASGSRELTVFGITDKGKELIKNNKVNLPKDVSEFISKINRKSHSNKQAAFIADVFNSGKNPSEGALTAAEKGRQIILRKYANDLTNLHSGLDEIMRSKTFSIAERRQALVNIKVQEKELIDRIVVELGENVKNIEGKLLNAGQNYLKKVELHTSLGKGNAILDKSGAFYDIGRKKTRKAILDIWDAQPDPNPNWESIRRVSGITREQESVAQISKTMDETGYVLISHTGARKLKIEILGSLTEKQSEEIIKIASGNNYDTIDFIVYELYGERMAGASTVWRQGADKVGTPDAAGFYQKGKGISLNNFIEKIKETQIDHVSIPKKLERRAPKDEAVQAVEEITRTPPGYTNEINTKEQQKVIDYFKDENNPLRIYDPEGKPVTQQTPEDLKSTDVGEDLLEGQEFDEATRYDKELGILDEVYEGVDLPDSVGFIFKDGKFAIIPSGPNATKKQIKDSYRSAIIEAYDLAEDTPVTKLDEIIVEFLNTTQAIKYESRGGKITIITSTPVSPKQAKAINSLNHPQYRIDGYSINIRAVDGEQKAKTLFNKTFTGDDVFEVVEKQLRKLDKELKGKGWDNLRAARKGKKDAANKVAKLTNIEGKRAKNYTPRRGRAIVEDAGGNQIDEGEIVDVGPETISIDNGGGPRHYPTHQVNKESTTPIITDDVEEVVEKKAEEFVDMTVAEAWNAEKFAVVPEKAGKLPQNWEAAEKRVIKLKKRADDLRDDRLERNLDRSESKELADEELAEELDDYAETLDQVIDKHKVRMEEAASKIDAPVRPESLSKEEITKRRERVLSGSVDVDLLDEGDDLGRLGVKRGEPVGVATGKAPESRGGTKLDDVAQEVVPIEKGGMSEEDFMREHGVPAGTDPYRGDPVSEERFMQEHGVPGDSVPGGAGGDYGFGAGGQGPPGSLPGGTGRAHIPEGESELQEAARLQDEAVELFNNGKVLEAFRKFEQVDIIRRRNIGKALKAGLGMEGEVSSANVLLGPMQEEIYRLRVVEKYGKGDYIPGQTVDGILVEKKIVSQFDRDQAKAQIKIIEMRINFVAKRTPNPIKRIEDIKKELAEIDTLKASVVGDEQLASLQMELDYLENIVGLGVEKSTPLEQITALRRHQVKLATDIENIGLAGKEISELEIQKVKIDNAIEHLKLTYPSDYLEAERYFLGKKLYDSGIRANKNKLDELNEAMLALDNKIKEASKGTGAEKQIEEWQTERNKKLIEAVNIRSDIEDSVQALTFPDMKFGRDPIFADFMNIVHSRGWIGKGFETFLTAKIKNRGLQALLTTVRFPFKIVVGGYDPTTAFKEDSVAATFIAYQKAVNWGKTKDMEVANKLKQFGDMPFKINKKGGWEGGTLVSGLGDGVPVADMLENLPKYRKAFNAEQNAWADIVEEEMKNITKYAKEWGLEQPDIFLQISRVFREVISVRDGKINLTEAREQLALLRLGDKNPPNSFRERIFETLIEGIANGVKYEYDVNKAVIHQIQIIRSYAIEQSMYKTLGNKFGRLEEVLLDSDLTMVLFQTKKDKTDASTFLEWAKDSVGRGGEVFSAKVPGKNWNPDSKSRILPPDLIVLRDRILTNNALDAADPERLKEAIHIIDDAEDVVLKYNKFSLEAEDRKKDILKKTFKFAEDYMDDYGGKTPFWNERKLDPNDEHLIMATPALWRQSEKGQQRYMLEEDVKYIEKQMGRGRGDLGKALQVAARYAGSAAGKVRLIQTALDFAFPFINGPLLFGYDMWQFEIGLVTLGRKGKFSAAPFLHPAYKAAAGIGGAVGKGYKPKSSSIFGEAMWQAGSAMRSPERRSKYWLREMKLHEEEFKAWTKYARVSGLPHELSEFGFYENIEKKILGSIPIAKELKVFERFQDGFTSYLNAGSWEFFKSSYHIAADNQKSLMDLGDISRNMIGMHSGAELGISKGQLSMERVAFYAPSFTRASFAVMGKAFTEALNVGTLGAAKTGSFGGKRALESMMGLFTAMTFFVGAYTFAQQFVDSDYSLDKMNWKDVGNGIKDYWTPGKGFWAIKGAEGAYTGLGGAMRSNTQLIFKMMNVGFEGTKWSPSLGEGISSLVPDFKIHPDKFIPHPFGTYDGPELSQIRNNAIKYSAEMNFTKEEAQEYMDVVIDEYYDERNKGDFWRHPIVRWYRGKAGVLTGTAWDILSGNDFLGYKTDRWNIPDRLTNLLPFYVQEALDQRRATSKATLAGIMGKTFFGLTNIPKSSFDHRRDTFAKKQNMSVDELFSRDESGSQKYFRVINAMETDREEFPEEYAAHQEYLKDMEDKDGPYARFDEGKLEIFQRRDAEIADAVNTNMNWNNPESVKQVSRAISNAYAEANARKNDLAEEIFGKESEGVIEFYEGIPLDDLSPQAVLQWASEIENFRNPITKKIDYAKKESVINEAVSKLPEIERQKWIASQYNDIGNLDIDRFEAGDYQSTNEYFNRKDKAQIDLDKWLNAPKYRGTTVQESDSITKLLDTVSQASQLLQLSTGKFYSKKKILQALNQVMPGNKIFMYALISTYTALAPMIRSTEKFDIMMRNPDVVLFHPFTITGFSLDEDQKELWAAKWDGNNDWQPKTKIVEDLLADRDTGIRRNFGYDLDEEDEEEKILGFPTKSSWYEKQLSSINPF